MELMPIDLPFCEIAGNLIEKMNDNGREHYVETQHTNRAIRNRGLGLEETRDRLFLSIDFGATMTLVPNEKLNCHENAHCVDLVIIAHMNGRFIEIFKDGSLTVSEEDGSVTKHYIRDTMAIHAFAETISKGKKTDAWMIRRTLQELLVTLIPSFEEKGMKFKGVDIASDNCKNQNKCCNHFWFMATLAESIAPRLYVAKAKRNGSRDFDDLDHTTVEGMKGFDDWKDFQKKYKKVLPPNWIKDVLFDARHQYSEVYQGKGAHDGDAAKIKLATKTAEQAGNRVPDGNAVHRVMTEKMGSKTGIKQMKPERAKLEKHGNPAILKAGVIEGDITHRCFYYFSEKKDEVKELRRSGRLLCHFIERSKPPQSTSTVNHTNSFKEVYFPIQDLTAKDRVMFSSTRSCPCQKCLANFNADDCSYKHERTVRYHVMRPMNSSEIEEDAMRATLTAINDHAP